jgi:hypothetical protein
LEKVAALLLQSGITKQQQLYVGQLARRVALLLVHVGLNEQAQRLGLCGSWHCQVFEAA